MSTDITQLVMDRYFINELHEEIINKNKELQERWTLLRTRCHHPTHKTTKDYNSGGYDYKSSVTITETCTICDKVLKSFEDPKHVGSYA